MKMTTMKGRRREAIAMTSADEWVFDLIDKLP